MARSTLSQTRLKEYARMGAQVRIAELRRELAALEAEFGKGSGRPKPAGGKRKMSAAGRQRIAAAARKRWAKWRAEHKPGKK